MTASESAVIVPVPEAEQAVGELRAALDPAAREGVPAHVTVLYPFLPPDRIGPGELRRLRAAVRSVPRFVVTFTEVRWFDEDVVWLAPEPAAGFRALTAAVCAEFPGFAPYGGAHGDPVPHLTVGHGADPADLRAAAALLPGRLPVTATVDAVHLFQGRPVPETWRSVADLPLG